MGDRPGSRQDPRTGPRTPDSGRPDPDRPSPGQDRITRILESVIRRRGTGETIADDDVIAEHPDLMPDLGSRLQALQRIEQAERQARSGVEHDSRDKPPPEDDPALGKLPANLFPGYELLGEMDYGGQGVVYRAVQKTTRRQVAVKVMRRAGAGQDEYDRFRREVRILAQLDHPGIVSVHESGQTGNNLYSVMDYVAGEALDVYLATRKLPVRDTLALCAEICDAVNAAHLHGIIHRDLKPANILVGPDRRPRILDFGLAKIAPGGGSGDSLAQAVTATGQFMGSLPWASPEQAEGVSAHVDLRTDVYSLGVILYHMLTGRFPYEITGNMRNVLDNILQAEPVSPASIRKDIDDEVQTIVLKCLSKERDRRYQSAGELARDIRRYLAGEPIEAKRESGWYILKKQLRRHRVPVAIAVAWVCIVTVALAVSLAFWRQAAVQRDQAVTARTEARRAQTAQERQRQLADRARVLAEDRELLARRHLYAANMNAALQAWKDGDTRRVLELLDANRPMPGQIDLRGFEWHHLLNICHQDLATLRGHSGNVNAVAFSPDGSLLATASDDQTVILWEVATFSSQACLRGHRGPVTAVAFSSDGRIVATAGMDKTARLWDPRTGRQQAGLQGHTGPVSSLAFAPDGCTLATAAGDIAVATGAVTTDDPGDTTVRLWDVTTGQCRAVLAGHTRPVMCAAFSPDGRVLATGDGHVFDGGEVRLWDPVTGRQIAALKGYTDEVYSVAFSPDGSLLATGSRDRTLKVWDLAARQVARTYGHHPVAAHDAVFSPDGRLLATCSGSMVKLWDVDTGAEKGMLVGHTARVSSAAFAPDGHMLVTGSYDNTAKVWNPSRLGACAALRGHANDVRCLAFSPDGRTLATGSFDATVKLWDTATGRERATLTGHTFFVESVAFSPDGKTLVTSSQDRTVMLWDTATGKPRRTIAKSAQSGSVALTPDGKMLAVAPLHGQIVELHGMDTMEVVHTIATSHGEITHLALSPDGGVLAVACHDRAVELWDLATRRRKAVLQGQENIVTSVAFSPDGRTLVSGSWDGTANLWEVSTGQKVLTLNGHLHGLFSVAFSPDGGTIATSAWDGLVKLWDPVTGLERMTLQSGARALWCVAFSPDGRVLAAGGRDGALFLWQAPRTAE